ncbi:MAG: HAD family hydrolase [Solirubrobacteraceae bacterium]
MADWVVLWDFDGTLGYREGLWSACAIEVLDEHSPGHAVTLEMVRESFKGGFFWNRHEQPHTHLADPERWWAARMPMLVSGLERCGVPPERTRELAQEVRMRFVDPSIGWRLFEDVTEALTLTRGAGMHNAIVSNHVPELPAIASALGLDGLVERVFTSAATGYEKPHPEMFRIALRELGEPVERWMVGDNALADVAGAQALGIPALQVRTGGLPDALAAARQIVGTQVRARGGAERVSAKK